MFIVHFYIMPVLNVYTRPSNLSAVTEIIQLLFCFLINKQQFMFHLMICAHSTNTVQFWFKGKSRGTKRENNTLSCLFLSFPDNIQIGLRKYMSQKIYDSFSWRVVLLHLNQLLVLTENLPLGAVLVSHLVIDNTLILY